MHVNVNTCVYMHLTLRKINALIDIFSLWERISANMVKDESQPITYFHTFYFNARI